VDNTYNVIRTFYDKMPAPLLKISGGELFIYHNIFELLEKLSKIYAHIQVITNGVLLTEEIVDRVAALKNIGFNFSMDGHTAVMNSNRFQSEKMNQKLVAIFEYALKKLGEIEITSVITDVNYKEYKSFLSYLSGLKGKIVAFPIPVRGNEVNRLFSQENRLEFAGILMDAIVEYPAVLGPSLYYQRLAEFLKSEKISRKDQCLIPLFAVQVFDTGVVTPCPLGWTLSFGNVKENENDEVFSNIKKHKIYDLLTYKKPKMTICKDCFSQTDIITYYLNNMLPLEEVAGIPMYKEPEVQERLQTIKNELLLD
jgi:MoaA/NifB/PqqE/SkfB family radical SAM enzyme